MRVARPHRYGRVPRRRSSQNSPPADGERDDHPDDPGGPDGAVAAEEAVVGERAARRRVLARVLGDAVARELLAAAVWTLWQPFSATVSRPSGALLAK